MKYIIEVFALLLALVIASFTITTVAEAEQYKLITTVIVANNGWIVVEDMDGEDWMFETVKPYNDETMCVLTMDDRNTDSVYDDKIIGYEFIAESVG